MTEETPSQAGRVQFGVDPSLAVPPHPNVAPGAVATAFEHDVAQAEIAAPPRLSEATMAELRELATRYPRAQSALLPMLHLVQSSEGFVTPAGVEACAEILEITAAEVSAVATFYTMYKRRPIGDYLVGVCTNTLCAVMGGDEIFDRVKSHLDVGNDETTPDGLVTLEHIECNAACDYAPVVMVNWEFFDNQTPQSVTDLVDDLRSGQTVRASRGARVCTWREAERVLAGFPDNRANEGPVGGPATLVGLELARRNNWTAPRPGTTDASASGGTPSSSDDPVSAAPDTAHGKGQSDAIVDQDVPASGENASSDTATGKGTPPQ